MFAFVSGRASLDLLGTLKWRRDDNEEQLADPAAWRAWVKGSDLDVALTGPVDAEALTRVRQVREALYRAVTAARSGQTVPRRDLLRLNGVARGEGPRQRLDRQGHVRQAGTVDQLLTALVRDAFALLAGADANRIRDCSNPRCTRLFVDSSRAGTRRWCGMTECGNAAKVAAFRARQRPSP